MAPLVAALLKFGFSTIAGVVAAKGPELIKEKLGVDVGSLLGTEEGRIKLKTLELQHEEFLITTAQSSEVRDLDYFKAEVADRDSARSREAAVNAGSPWYVPSFVSLLTVLVVVGGGFMFFRIEDVNARMVIVAQVSMVLAYYYGTTRNSGTKDSTLASALERAMDKNP
jgi:hypothetical protein